MKKGYLGIIVLICIVLTSCQNQITIEESEQIAKQFILNSSKINQKEDSLELISNLTLKCQNCYVFIYSFESIIEDSKQENNKHYADVFVKEGEIIQATIDNKWDEITKRNLESFEMIDYKETKQIPVYICREPRPNKCDEFIEPVCSSNKEEYINGCLACQSTKSKWYTKGKCEMGFNEKAAKDLREGKITKESAQVLILINSNR